MHPMGPWLPYAGENPWRSRSVRGANRAAEPRARSLRHRLGVSLVRLGRRVGGEAMTSSAWQG